jgi:signal recognition particle subunit SRP54
MEELGHVRDAVKPTNVVLVLDAMTGQEAVNVAKSFDERIAFDGVILTKLDGDARGGAALSVKSVTGKPIMYASTGEKLDALEVFHPDRMASRILGMGDVLTLIERAEQAATEDEQAAMEARMRKGQFTFDDFLSAQKMLRRMGPLQGVLKLIPGLGSQLGDLDVDESRMKRVEAMVLSMTPHERAVPHLIDGKRRQRIARGSGTQVQEVNQLLEARKMMERAMKQMGKGKMPALPGLQPPAAGGMPTTRHPGSKRKKTKRKSRR